MGVSLLLGIHSMGVLVLGACVVMFWARDTRVYRASLLEMHDVNCMLDSCLVKR